MARTNIMNHGQEVMSVRQDVDGRRGTSLLGNSEKYSTENTANILLVDVSGSTSAKIGRGDNRSKLIGIKEALTKFISSVPAGSLVGIIVFGSSARVLRRLSPVGSNRLNIINEVQSLTSHGTTAMNQALRLAVDEFRSLSDCSRLLRAYLKTDGISTDGDPRRMAEQLKALGVQLHCIGFGDQGQIDEGSLKDMASMSTSGQPFCNHFVDALNMTTYFKRQSVVYTQ